jgi:hypothetical protein
MQKTTGNLPETYADGDCYFCQKSQLSAFACCRCGVRVCSMHAHDDPWSAVLRRMAAATKICENCHDMDMVLAKHDLTPQQQYAGIMTASLCCGLSMCVLPIIFSAVATHRYTGRVASALAELAGTTFQVRANDTFKCTVKIAGPFTANCFCASEPKFGNYDVVITPTSTTPKWAGAFA